MHNDPGDEWNWDDSVDAARYAFGWDLAKEGTESFTVEGLRRLAEAVFGKEPITESEYDEKIAPAIMDYLRERK